MADSARKPRYPHGGKVESLSKGDTIFLESPGRVTIKKTGANGGHVRAVVYAKSFKVVKQGRK